MIIVMNYIAIPGMKERTRLKNAHKGDRERTVKAICDIYDITESSLFKKTRKHPLPEARFLCFYILFHEFGFAKVAIAALFNLDHTTIINGIKTFSGWMLVDSSYSDKLKAARMLISNL